MIYETRIKIVERPHSIRKVYKSNRTWLKDIERMTEERIRKTIMPCSIDHETTDKMREEQHWKITTNKK